MASSKEKVLVLLDMHAILHRAYHALPNFYSPKGEPTGAVYGLTTFLLKAIRELKPDYLAACFDLPGPTFRHAAYDNYKGKRPDIASDLVSQIKRSYDIMKAFGVPAFEHPSFEADDIIGTIVEKTKKEKNLKTIIASGDLDTLQLVSNKRVQVYTLRKGLSDTILYDEKSVEERYGFGPKLVPDFKGLKGDPSDNIVGIPGIGDKTATELIMKFGTIENIYKLAKENGQALLKAGIKERTLKLLLEHEEEALFSKTLAQIRKDAPIPFSIGKMEWRKSFKKENLQDLLKDLGFMSLLSRVEEFSERALEAEQITASRDLKSLFQASEIWWHYSEISEKIYAVSGAGVFELNLEKNRTEIKEVMSRCAKNYYFDAKKIFHKLGFTSSIGKDILITAWLCRSNLGNLTLKDAIHNFLPKEFIGENDDLRAVSLLPELSKAVDSELEEKKLGMVWADIELPLIPILFDMETRGILLNLDHLKKLSTEFSSKLGELEKDIWKKVGFEFNISSPKQLSEALFEKLKLSVKGGKKTSSGARSTRESELIKIKDLHPSISKILQFRELSKLQNTYIDALPKLADESGRVHTTFVQTGTSTGRVSSAEPNLQNIPIRSEYGREVRKAFIARQGSELVAFDYSQLELRIAAILSKDRKMISAFRAGKDIHTITAREIFNVSESEVTSEMRREAKVINFGILYGMGINALAAAMEVSREKAERFWEEYFRDFEGVTKLIEKIKKEVRRDGFVETMFGRRRYIPEINSGAEYIRKEAERMAINAPIQGTEADIVKIGMIRADKFIKENKLQDKASLILQIHDELLFEVRKEAMNDFIPQIVKILETIYESEVPLVVDVKHGVSWGEMGKWNSKK